MRIFDKTKKIELNKENIDLTKGYLVQDVLITILPEQQEQIEESHLELIAEYANGGKSYKKVIDKQYVPYLPQREEKEEIQVYIEYTAEELQKIATSKELAEIEQWFTQYYRVFCEHECCQRLGVDCHHNINEWDIQAVEKAKRLKEIREV